jgi:hypothetical protein
MKRLGLAAGVVLVIAVVLSAETGQSRQTADAGAGVRSLPRATFFEKYCFECHSGAKPEGGVAIDKLTSAPDLETQSFTWEKVAEMLESGDMPAPDATAFPTDAERAAAIHAIRSTLSAYETETAGRPGRVTVRRLTSGEYRYVIRDLTAVDVPVSIDTSSDAVGGEGFSNFGDVQFVEDANVERYLEAAKLVANHAVIGSGPLAFHTDPGKTGLELSALARINNLYETRGFRVVSGEGGRPYGLDRYAKAFFVAWYYKHRVALGDAAATIRGLAAKEGITGRFADHIWTVVNMPAAGYPTSETIERFKAMPAPKADVSASIAEGRRAATALQEYLTTWPSWFFARGDLAAGGAGDESPLAFNDETLRVSAARRYTYSLAPRAARGRGAPAAAPSGPIKVYLTFTNLNPSPGVRPVVIWRNARIVTRSAAAGRGGRGGAAPPGALVGRGAAAPAELDARPLREALPADVAASFKFGVSPDGTAMGPNDFATEGTVSFDAPAAVAGTALELQVDAELGKDRNGVVRLMLSDRAEGSSRDVAQKVLLADETSAGYRTFRASMAQYASLLPPNSHGEANPADKDPVPAPFDNTYNSPEHDAFVLKVKYQRTDDFFTANMVDGADRDALNHAWNDLFGSWPYHDAYLGMLADHYKVKLASPRMADMTPARIAALPEAMRGYVAPLRAHYDQVTRAFKAAEPGHLTDAIEFASHAWRRPLSNAEKANLRAFYQRSKTTGGLDHDGAIRALLARILMSPAFLYRLETVAAAGERPLTNWELASRLSFFMWSSVPDAELRRAAAAGELTRPAMLEQQVRRMAADPKARRLATEFFGQWLGFYQFDEFRGVDTGKFPEFTTAVQASMYDEAVSTFEYLVREKRPVSEILDADYAFLNAPLVKFYGLEGRVDVKSTGDVVKVTGAKAINRGGALRLGSVLTVTSAPLRTSPVKRGDWVLRRILGTPTPPPPADAGSIPADPAGFGGLSLRERLTEHKRNPTCANCHLRIDPLGFPLEVFDNLGRTRAAYPDGKPVDVVGEFADKSTISGPGGLVDYLRSREALVMRTLSRKMIGYALGRTVLPSDQRLVTEMVAAGGQATIADLAVKVVTSRQFLNRDGQGGAPPAPRSTTASVRPSESGARP